MSRQLINDYRAELDRLQSASGSRRESVLREAFKDLLKRWGKSRDLIFVPEHQRFGVVHRRFEHAPAILIEDDRAHRGDCPLHRGVNLHES